MWPHIIHCSGVLISCQVVVSLKEVDILSLHYCIVWYNRDWRVLVHGAQVLHELYYHLETKLEQDIFLVIRGTECS